MPNYADVSSVVANETDRAILLSGSSIALLFTALGEWLEKPVWLGSSGDGALTEVEQDTVDAWIARAEKELMGDIVTTRLPSIAHIFHYENYATVGNAISAFVSAGQLHNGYAMQNTPALNNEWLSAPILLADGDYILSVNFIKNSQSGRLRLSWNGVQLGDVIDLYNSSVVNNHILTFVVSASGENQISGLVSGKNSSSTDYRCMISDFWLKPLSIVG